MLSERRRAQTGLIAGCLILVTTLTILYQGSKEASAGQGRNGVGVASVVRGEGRLITSDPGVLRMVSLGK